MSSPELPQSEIRIQNIRDSLESLMVTLFLDTESAFEGDRMAELEVKITQIESLIKQLRELSPNVYIEHALESLAHMSPTMHKVAVLKCLQIIRQVIEEDKGLE